MVRLECRALMGAGCQKPEVAALLDLCSKALINCTRMEAGSESLLSLPEVRAHYDVYCLRHGLILMRRGLVHSPGADTLWAAMCSDHRALC